MPNRSRTDLLRWAAALLTEHGFRHEYGFHVVEWEHDDWCPLDPKHGLPHVWSRCECQPHSRLVLHFGTNEERRIEVVRDGIPLPVRRSVEVAVLTSSRTE